MNLINVILLRVFSSVLTRELALIFPICTVFDFFKKYPISLQSFSNLKKNTNFLTVIPLIDFDWARQIWILIGHAKFAHILVSFFE